MKPPAKLTVTLTVNGRRASADCEPRRTLADFLRHDLGLTGVHVGCEQGSCGSCTVLLDGATARSCCLLAAQADGAEITTVEGMAAGGALSPLQEEFRRHHALQCGFCTPGMLATATELLRDNPRPTEAEIRTAIAGNLCRCTGYQHIVDAIKAAADRPEPPGGLSAREQEVIKGYSSSGPRDARSDMSQSARVGRYGDVANALALRSDRQLAESLERARVLGSGIGGTSVLLDVDGVPVFAKRIPLTDLERRADNVMSTANLFGLPPSCQYGVGGPSFGAWRELAANVMTTNWVLAGRTAAFPLLYHWRVLPGAPPPGDEHADVEAVVRYWDGSPAVRDRLHAVARASAGIVLFQEYIPHNLDDWLAARLAAGPDAATAASAMVESCLLTDVAFMNGQGLMHFDAHFGNILTDGERLYIGDLGLATSPRFDLSEEEAEFLDRNTTHDLGYAVMRLVNWLVTNVCGVRTPPDGIPVRRNEYIRACAAGADPAGAPPAVAAVIRRYAPVAAAMNDFYWDLFGTSRATPYPREEVERAMSAMR